MNQQQQRTPLAICFQIFHISMNKKEKERKTSINIHQGHKKIKNNFLNIYEFYRYFSPGWRWIHKYSYHNISDGKRAK